ncbi:MAG: hypothetical protein NUV63_02250 [Gallionella sp.]|nr:hypothetical protein [Gallionella sp.]
MGELLLVITIVTLVVLAIRRGKPVVLDNPVIIHRHGQYHITLAPQLNRAQTFIEQIARQFMLLHPSQGDLPTQYYEVRDPMVFARGGSAYLLAASLRDGILYFQAINPQPLIYDADSHYKTLSEFSGAVLKQHPPSTPADQQWAEKLRDSIGTIAGQLNITVEALQSDR